VEASDQPHPTDAKITHINLHKSECAGLPNAKRTMERMYFLGIDVGTGGTRALVIDEHGRTISSATEDHQAFSSPQIGWAEQDPADWWRACRIAVSAALAQAKLSGEQIACVGLSGQMHGAVLLDRQDVVIRPALIWCDLRTEKQCRDLTAQIGRERLVQLTCNPALANFTLTKCLWVRENEPGNWERVRSLLLPKDYIRFELTGERAIDVADASGTLMLDVARRRWSMEMLELVGMDESFLPRLYESSEICGQISSLGAAATGLKIGTPVVAGAGDQAAGAIGMGVVSSGMVSATIGTSGVVLTATDRPALDSAGRVHTFCHAVPKRWIVMGVTQAAGLSLRWFRDRFGVAPDQRAETYDELVAEAAKANPGCDGLLWAPYLMGERTPHLDPAARAALVGLTATHTRAQVIRSILEGVAFSLRDTFTIFQEMSVPVNSVRLGGGGSRSALWRQIQSEVYAQPVETVQAEEGAAYGAAILAGVGVKAWSSVDSACKEFLRPASHTSPDAQRSAIMETAYTRYRRIYPAMKSIGN
jgi:xylulokinase